MNSSSSSSIERQSTLDRPTATNTPIGLASEENLTTPLPEAKLPSTSYGLLLLITVNGLGITAAFLAFFWLRNVINDQFRSSVSLICQDWVRTVLNEYKESVFPIFSMAAYISAKGVHIDRQKFYSFLEEASFDQQIGNKSATSYLCYAPRLDNANRALWENQTNHKVLQWNNVTNGQQFTIRAYSPVYLPIQIIFPRALESYRGVDLASDPERFGGLAKAISTLKSQNTAFINKHRFEESGVSTIMPLFNPALIDVSPTNKTIPVMKVGDETANVPDAFLGVVTGLFNVKVAFQKATAMNSLDLIHLRANDFETGVQEYQSDGYDETLDYMSVYIEFGFPEKPDPLWSLKCVPSITGRDRLTSFAYNIMLVGILIISFLLSVVCCISSNRYRRIRQTVKRKTAQLEWSQQSLQAVMSSMKDMLLSFDGNLNIIQANKSALRALKYSRSGLIGTNLAYILRSEDFGADYIDIVIHHEQQELANQLAAATSVPASTIWGRLLGRRSQSKQRQKPNPIIKQWLSELKEFEVCRSDGTIFDAEINFSQVERMENNIFIAVFRDVTERKQMISDLATSKKNVEEALASKGTLLAWICHELRNPLHAIAGMADLLMSTPNTLNPSQKTFVSAIQTSSELMESIANDVLDMSKFEAGKLDIKNVTFDIWELLAEMDSVYSLVGQKKNIDFKVDFDQRQVPRFVHGDPIRMRQVLVNLLSNAMKFTHKGMVGLFATVEDHDQNCKTISFKVQDTGIGIDNADLPKLFNTFVQVNHDTKHQYKGSGLGLYIVKSLVERMNGAVSVESIRGEGSSFYAQIPIKTGSFTAILSEGNKKWLNSNASLETENTAIDHRDVETPVARQTSVVMYYDRREPKNMPTRAFEVMRWKVTVATCLTDLIDFFALEQADLVVLMDVATEKDYRFDIIFLRNCCSYFGTIVANCPESFREFYSQATVIISDKMTNTKLIDVISTNLPSDQPRQVGTPLKRVARSANATMNNVAFQIPRDISLSLMDRKSSFDIRIVVDRQAMDNRQKCRPNVDEKIELLNPTIFSSPQDSDAAQRHFEDSIVRFPISKSLKETVLLKVLFAEDSPVNQQLGIMMLIRGGCDVVPVNNGLEAVKAYEEHLRRGFNFDLILLDMNMPEMDGPQAAAELKQRGWTGPLVALTANAKEEDRAKFAEKGLDAYLTKPIKQSVLIKTLTDLVAQFRRQ